MLALLLPKTPQSPLLYRPMRQSSCGGRNLREMKREAVYHAERLTRFWVRVVYRNTNKYGVVLG